MDSKLLFRLGLACSLICFSGVASAVETDAACDGKADGAACENEEGETGSCAAGVCEDGDGDDECDEAEEDGDEEGEEGEEEEDDDEEACEDGDEEGEEGCSVSAVGGGAGGAALVALGLAAMAVARRRRTSRD